MDSDEAFAIGELSRRTGVPQATLRTWESRYGLPRPHRLPGGHRRYDAASVREVEQVLAHRAAGLNAEAAVARVVAERGSGSPSVFATLRAGHPELLPQRLTKQTLMALTRAIEDEYVARADRPTLFATFQHERFFRQSEARWRSLARTAAFAAVFADFDRSTVDETLCAVALAPDSALGREWVLVCDSPVQAACVAAWEIPGQEAEPDARREFEALWTVDAGVVRLAATVCAEQVQAALPEVADGLDRLLRDPAPEPSADLRRANALFHRVLGYLDDRA